MIIAVDFDGTCVEHRYPAIGPDAPGAVGTLKWLVERGCRIILWTMRSGKELDDAVQWFQERDIPLFGVNENPEQHVWTTSHKAHADLYIDDRAFGVPLNSKGTVDWFKVLAAIK